MVFVLVYEWQARRVDERWRADYDAEGLLERVTVASEDPVLLWRYRPDARHDWLQTNEHGFRERPTARQKPEGEHRVAFVGDSVVLGWGVPAEQTSARLLEDDPPADWPPRTRCLNFGVDGYHAVQIARLLESVVCDFGPDRIVYVLCPNDFDFEDASGRKIDYFDPPRSFLWRRLRRALSNRLSSRDDYHLRHLDRRRDEVFAALRSMKQAADRVNAAFELVVVPVFPDRPDFDGYPIHELHDTVAAFAADEGIPHRDLLGPLQETGLAPRALGQDTWHLSAEGHRRVAEALRR